jgi:hypothetical protein
MARCAVEALAVPSDVPLDPSAVMRDLLVQIAFMTHEAHTNQGNAQITALLDKIASQKIQASGIEGQRVVQAVFGLKSKR